MTESGLEDLLRESKIPPEVGKALVLYHELLKKWNVRVNLTSSSDWSVLGPLFREGVWASSHYPDGAVAHLDIGSGAGFPAMVLRILKPNMRLDLVESRGKKCIFLETVAASLGLGSVSVHPRRLGEYLQGRGRGKRWDLISWKGLKLSGQDLEMLRAHAHEGTQLWMFHGREPAVADPNAMEHRFRLFKVARFQGRRLWMLSIYIPR